ncbi:hypothetical protein GQ55_5G234400 [Panicum hallii var. hallii]|uniref:Uncharacterized protein n=1 Tax=Panicum hallii var. hallii TaxID=1504633 RepID=A0A2T7DJG8_9POAL|nr:hypothetical protein GQ55_5G234400 [Panicum hallii var. hallii]
MPILTLWQSWQQSRGLICHLFIALPSNHEKVHCSITFHLSPYPIWSLWLSNQRRVKAWLSWSVVDW